MVGAPVRRRQVAYVHGRGLSIRRACALMSVARSTSRYESRLVKRDEPVVAVMRELAAQYPRYGYRRIQVFRGRRGHVMSVGKLLLTQTGLQLLHKAVLAKCDMDDGVKDGVIGDPSHCKFDPAELLCKHDQSAGCLTAAQIEAAKKIYSGPVTSQGKKTYTGGPLPGSELNWIDGGASEPYAYSSSNLENVNAADTIFRYLAFMPPAGPAWKASDLISTGTTNASAWSSPLSAREIRICGNSKGPAANFCFIRAYRITLIFPETPSTITR